MTNVKGISATSGTPAAVSPFGPQRKKPAPKVPGPRQPADRVTPLSIRPRPLHATPPAYDVDLVWLAAEAQAARDRSDLAGVA